MRESCIDILHKKVSSEFPISRDRYAETLADWDISPLFIDDKHIGVVMLRNREIHVVIEQEQALRHARRIIRECLEKNIEKHGYLTTISFKEQKIVRFLERLGFYKTGEDDTFYSFRIDKTKIH